jgi:GDP-4-dehydro-6-deoxy-D-mannose reductase
MVDVARPDIVIHLAGVAFPPDADIDPAAAYDINTLGAVRLLASLAARRRTGSLDPVVVVVGSALQYGLHDAGEMPLAETAEQRPATVYAATKAAQEVAALQTARTSGLRVLCTRSFNHAGVGQPAEYLLPSLVGRVLRMRGDPEVSTLKIGNDAVRDYLHVRDVADAYLALAERGRPGTTYNVCSGAGIRVSELAADILRRAGVDGVVHADRSLSRTTDVPVLIGSPDALMRDTGWTPRRTTGDIIDDLLGFAHAATD